MRPGLNYDNGGYEMLDDGFYYHPHPGDDESWLSCSLTQGWGNRTRSDFVG